MPHAGLSLAMRETLRHGQSHLNLHKCTLDLPSPTSFHPFLSNNNYSVVTMADIANRAKQVAKEDAERIKVLAQDAIQSRAYLYPIKVNPLALPKAKILTILGNLLLRLPQRSLASDVVKTRPNAHDSNRRNNSNVRPDLRPSSSCIVTLQRSPRIRINNHARPIRKFNLNKRHHKNLLHRRCPPRHFRWRMSYLPLTPKSPGSNIK